MYFKRKYNQSKMEMQLYRERLQEEGLRHGRGRILRVMVKKSKSSNRSTIQAIRTGLLLAYSLLMIGVVIGSIIFISSLREARDGDMATTPVVKSCVKTGAEDFSVVQAAVVRTVIKSIAENYEPDRIAECVVAAPQIWVEGGDRPYILEANLLGGAEAAITQAGAVKVALIRLEGVGVTYLLLGLAEHGDSLTQDLAYVGLALIGAKKIGDAYGLEIFIIQKGD
jgi:hypothetical protein